MVKRAVFIFFLFGFALLLTMPKEDIYFGLERELAKQGIELNEGSVEEGIFDLVLKDVAVYIQGVKVATVKKVSFYTLFFYSKVKIEILHTDEGMRSVFSAHFEKVLFSYSIVHPLHIYIKARGSMGEMDGEIFLNKRKVYIDFKNPGKAAGLKRFLKKDERGWYYGF
jgi:hypothetical protein